MKTEKKTKIVTLMRSISRMMGNSKIIKTYDPTSFEETECAEILLPLKIQDELLVLADELEVENEQC